MAILPCSAVGERLLLLALIESCFQFGVIVSIFCSLEEEMKGHPKKRCPTKEKKNAKKKKEHDLAEMKTWYRASLEKYIEIG